MLAKCSYWRKRLTVFINRHWCRVHILSRNFGLRAEEVAEMPSMTDKELRLVFSLTFAVIHPCAKVTTACSGDCAVNNNAETFVTVNVFNNASYVSAKIAHVWTSIVRGECALVPKRRGVVSATCGCKVSMMMRGGWVGGFVSILPACCYGC